MNESEARKKPAAPPRTGTPRATRQPKAATPGAEQIRLRAYQFYLRRDGHPGDPLEDWLRAERELIAEMPAAKAATVRRRAG